MKISRRTFVRATGIWLALPWLESFAADPDRPSVGTSQPPRRMVCICAPLGLHPDNFFPQQTGKNYALSPYLQILEDYCDDMTVISGLAHAGMGSVFAHQASASFLTGVPGAGRPGFCNAISLDQYAADHIGTQTRFPSLAQSLCQHAPAPRHRSRQVRQQHGDVDRIGIEPGVNSNRQRATAY
ncbi:MAG: DUF1552 domain-containing protein [Planctomycetota bacterium]